MQIYSKKYKVYTKCIDKHEKNLLKEKLHGIMELGTASNVS